MVRHNNAISNGHFHKNWQCRVKINFNQIFKKHKRRLERIRKVKRNAPRPFGKLHPIVHCPSSRYHTKIRVGRGFSLYELKAAGLNKRRARTIGIAVDHRRRNKSVEPVQVSACNLRTVIVAS